MKIRQEFEDGEWDFVPKGKGGRFKTTDEIMFELSKKGFVKEYYNWTAHGEPESTKYNDNLSALVLAPTPVALESATH
ncbi:UNVERIFIED_CONTAM: hypothetical protein Slati_3214500 [Sesamum latifolium]|uniref:Transposase n=1 Tax=Sesamum latifolium TaxID=2727402 RepID=A0AAW2V3A3_9LAMI